ncbi:MBL fold metallo-hydrolase [Lelliottia sp. V89_10]|uniref:MBL fold metallo-hydrolase n=1 Tax=Lelliottia wanjuensis TaxID=3050585 RepID=UPI00249EC603|nr:MULTISPECIES: MBL fold metallo-hydrolase [unclassified Lelliottia]MDI3362167.1 MBL fold metallo-hydrolase [Lelliottia sp. V89_13]MDK9547992.1 MBL fold metallo-hydrolase [Lelliottia sp. V89_5]MDK9596956.1 MBL fold metallo-hydrolase [Lelliottia sp. V89_10]
MVWKNPWYNPSLKHHTPDGFRNIDFTGHQPGDVERWRKERKAAGLPKPPSLGYHDFVHQWWQPAELNDLSEDGVWWLGHASVLLRLDGQYLLTDPVFSRRASPLPFVGPERKTPPVISVETLPRLDALVISHNHYDHLDSATVRRLLRRFPDLRVFVPLGLGDWFRRRGAKSIIELDWWQSAIFQGLAITAVPAQHWSMRTFWNRNRSLWCGWVFEGTTQRFWFSGDTGYSPQLLAIPERLGEITAAALPAGAYAPRWFMSAHHMDPQSAIALWQQMGMPRAFPIHWGVFELADESLDEPVLELTQALSNVAPINDNFRILKIGQYLSL